MNLYYLGVQRCDRHKHWRRSTATPAPSYLPLIGVELTIAECTRLAITETGPRLGAVIRRAISNQHVSWRADGGEASWEAAHLTLPLQRCGRPTRWERQVADGAWAVVRAALHDRTLLAEDVEEDALARHLVVHPVPVRRQRARLISAIPGSQVQPPPHESAARRTLNEQACR